MGQKINNLRHLLERAQEGEDIDDILAEQAHDERVQQARQRLSDTIDEYSDDMTGQDGEEDIDNAAASYIQAQDDRLRARDPEGYAEKRAMGLL